MTNTTNNSKYLTLSAEQVAEKSKAQVALHIVRNLRADPTVQEKHQTGIFKQLMMAATGLSSAGCYTYIKNARQHLDGGDMYASNKKYNNKVAAAKRAAKLAETPAETVETPVVKQAAEVVKLNRWCVEDKTSSEVVNSFTTRTAAQDYNKQLKASGKDTRWFDNNKEQRSA